MISFKYLGSGIATSARENQRKRRGQRIYKPDTKAKYYKLFNEKKCYRIRNGFVVSDVFTFYGMGYIMVLRYCFEL